MTEVVRRYTESERKDGVIVVTFRDEQIAVANGDNAFRDELLSLVTPGSPGIVVDFTGVTDLSRAALLGVCVLRRNLLRHKAVLGVAGACEKITDALQLSTRRPFLCFPNRDAAIEKLRSSAN